MEEEAKEEEECDDDDDDDADPAGMGRRTSAEVEPPVETRFFVRFSIFMKICS